MGREPRMEFGGAICHVMNRGNHLDAIFKDGKDREMFLRTLEEGCEASGWVAHGFVLMRNHYHLLIETLRPTLVVGMQNLNSTYTRRYNARHKTYGHLFQGRYKALLVDVGSKGYFLTVSDYIHMNPVRLKGVDKVRELKDLLKDQWSSAGWLAGTRKGRPEWLRWERVYGELGFGNWKSRNRRGYRKYLERRIGEVGGVNEEWKKVRRGWCLGSEGFVEEMKERLQELKKNGQREPDSWMGEAVEEMEKDRAEQLMLEGIKKLGYERVEEVIGKDRYLLGRWLRRQTRVRVHWLAERLGFRTRGGMSSGISWIGQQIISDAGLKRKWKMLNANN